VRTSSRLSGILYSVGPWLATSWLFPWWCMEETVKLFLVGSMRIIPRKTTCIF